MSHMQGHDGTNKALCLHHLARIAFAHHVGMFPKGRPLRHSLIITCLVREQHAVSRMQGEGGHQDSHQGAHQGQSAQYHILITTPAQRRHLWFNVACVSSLSCSFQQHPSLGTWGRNEVALNDYPRYDCLASQPWKATRRQGPEKQ